MSPPGGRAILAACGSAVSLGLPFFRLGANRIVRGEAMYLSSVSFPVAAALVASWAVFAWAGSGERGMNSVPRVADLARWIAASLIIALPFAAAALAPSSPAGWESGLGDPASIARLSLGPGFWLSLLASFAAFLMPIRGESRGPRRAAASAAFIFVALLGASGALDSLSVAKEFLAQRSAFAAQLLRHLELAGFALLAGGAFGAVSGAAAARSKRLKSGLFFFLNLVQTIPSLALFGFLVIPLSALASRFPALRAAGIGGIGPAPALIALSLYAALPVARNCLTALELVPAAALDAGKGMGMARSQLFFRIELPLSLPLAIAGLRVAAVQAVGNTAVAALIGAGGLGVFIFQGLGQYAMDLVLLGTLPVIALSILVDAAMGFLGRASEPGRRYRGTLP